MFKLQVSIPVLLWYIKRIVTSIANEYGLKIIIWNAKQQEWSYYAYTQICYFRISKSKINVRI